MVKFLKKVKSLRPKGSPKYLLHRHLAQPDKGRSYATVHASSLTHPSGMCPRMYALADVTHTKAPDSWLSTSLKMTFQIGRDQERNIVLWFAEMGRAVCHWRCISCNQLHVFQKRPYACAECGVKKLDPEEVRFTSAVTGVGAGIDMILALGDPKMRVIEIKTMDKEQFKELKAPIAEHRWRTNLYLRTIAESGSSWANLIDTSMATILYTTKGGYGTSCDDVKKWGLPEDFSPFKEYDITRDDAETDDLALRARTVKEFRAGEVGMPEGICATAFSQRAQECPLKGVCFGGHHPPKHHWKGTT